MHAAPGRATAYLLLVMPQQRSDDYLAESRGDSCRGSVLVSARRSITPSARQLVGPLTAIDNAAAICEPSSDVCTEPTEEARGGALKT